MGLAFPRGDAPTVTAAPRSSTLDRVRSFALLLIVAGCGFRLNPAGSGTDGSNGSNGSNGIDAAIDTPASSNDMDGDGVPDNLDNCPTMANADQRDHDVDGRGDVCDLCPHIAEAADVDNDGDGVGDACDPRPTMAGDHRALWVGFYDASDISTWTGTLGWSVSGGRLTGGDNNVSLEYLYPPAFQHAFMQTSVRVNTLANPNGSVTPGAVIYNGDAGSTQYLECEIGQANNNPTPQMYALSPGHVDQKNWTGTLATNSELMFTDGVVGGMHTCTVTQLPNSNVSITQSASVTAGASVLGATNANVSYDYLWVVEIGP